MPVKRKPREAAVLPTRSTHTKSAAPQKEPHRVLIPRPAGMPEIYTHQFARSSRQRVKGRARMGRRAQEPQGALTPVYLRVRLYN